MAAPAKPAAKGGKKKGKWNLYEKSGDKIARKNKSCPKCGSGTFMAKHGNRSYCGNCHYTLFETQTK
ncbi:30S ribosomal protein S27ae [Candidatus Woesearchaeota archaeon]|nr:30S ribosomal protein S27ae [Candidatus Woesearchaeota archaeon]